MVMRDPRSAAIVRRVEVPAGRGVGGVSDACSMWACCQRGMRCGRFLGLAKKAKTRSTGYGSHCSVVKVCRMV